VTWGQAWRRLTDPSPEVHGVEDGRTARLVASCLVVILPLGLTSILVQLALSPAFLPTFLTIGAALAVLGAAYVLSRTRHYRLGAVLVVLVTAAAPLAAALVNPGDIAALPFAVLGVLVAVVFLPVAGAAAIAAFSLAGTGLILLRNPAGLDPGLRVGTFAFSLIASAVALLGALHHTLIRRDKRRIEQQLVLSDRLASIGMLAATVAHEINNPLASVLLNLGLVEDRLLKTGRMPEDTQRALGYARDGLLRMRDIVRDLQSFSRPEGTERRPVEVNALAASSARLVDAALRQRGRLVLETGQPLWALANESRLAQVLLNLTVNAFQALPVQGGGEVRIRTGRGPAETVAIEVQDTGGGIVPQYLGRIFDPFFTTKPGGSGLGLTITQALVTGMGGQISVESRPGRGACFRVTLSAAAAPASPRPAETAAAGSRLAP
jgi:signal transduction histidine kinase